MYEYKNCTLFWMMTDSNRKFPQTKSFLVDVKSLKIMPHSFLSIEITGAAPIGIIKMIMIMMMRWPAKEKLYTRNTKNYKGKELNVALCIPEILS